MISENLFVFGTDEGQLRQLLGIERVHYAKPSETLAKLSGRVPRAL